MNTCLFLTFKSGSAVATDELAQLTGFLRATPKLTKALLHTPASTSDPYVKDDPRLRWYCSFILRSLPTLRHRPRAPAICRR